ncbi:MAG TPA: BioY family transporter [Ruminococcaceae bacterium]|nr:BioY family transporter [Oscillospiraceae bacterium]
MDSTSVRTRTRALIRCAVCTALLVVLGVFEIPLPLIPITLQTFAVTLCGALLCPAEALAATGTYVLLGAVGLPVYSGFTGGLGILAGPTGGFLIGFLPGVFFLSLLLNRGFKFVNRADSFRLDIIRLATGLVIFTFCTYAVGTLWFTVSYGTTIRAAFSLCVWPFLPGAAIKCSALLLLYPALAKIRPVLYSQTT